MLKKLLAKLKRLGIRPAVVQDYLGGFPTRPGQQPKITPKFTRAQLVIANAMAVRFRRAYGWAPPPKQGTGSVLVAAGKGIILADPKGKPVTRPGKVLLHPVRRITSSDVRPFVEQNEGNVPHLYGDSRGNVTVGIGHLVPDLGAAQAIALINKFTGVPATPDEVARDFEIARTLGSELASDYEDPTILRLGPGEADRLFEVDFIVHFSAADNFYSMEFLPAPVQIGLFDLAFQRGGPALVAEYVDLGGALRRRDWSRAGREANAKQTPNRNAARQQKFQEALAFDFYFTTAPAKLESLLDHLMKL